jgi:hypothetical protein
MKEAGASIKVKFRNISPSFVETTGVLIAKLMSI